MPKCTDCEVLKLNLANAQTALAHAVAERDKARFVLELERQARQLNEDELKAERDALRADVTRVTAERDALAKRIENMEHEAAVEAEAQHCDMHAIEAERDALAKRWKDFKRWAFYDHQMACHDAFLVWQQIRALEEKVSGPIEGTVPYTPEAVIESTAFPPEESQ